MGISYCADNGHYKMFDSHARDIYGKSHPQGTCALLVEQVHYIQSLYGASDLFLTKRFTNYKV